MTLLSLKKKEFHFFKKYYFKKFDQLIHKFNTQFFNNYLKS